MYHFNTPRRLSELFINNKGGCSVYYPGIGDIEYVKDLLTETVVSVEFNCSQFGPTYPSKLGWVSTFSKKHCLGIQKLWYFIPLEICEMNWGLFIL